MLYPISVQTFETIKDRNYVYVDKTDLVYELAKEHVCFLSRPRRFGKSLLISTLEAYFLGRKDLFQGLKMESLETDWEEYPVFRIDFAGGDYTNPDELQNKLEVYIGNWEKKYGKDELRNTLRSGANSPQEEGFLLTHTVTMGSREPAGKKWHLTA